MSFGILRHMSAFLGKVGRLIAAIYSLVGDWWQNRNRAQRDINLVK
jgi:hypothetical protein